jgi:hypothetical protein
MLTYKATLTQNIAIYASLLVLALVHSGFWGVWLKGSRERTVKLGRDLKALAGAVDQLKQETTNFRSTVDQTREELDRRQKELDDLGNFLPSIKEKPRILREILDLIERFGIRIANTDFAPAESSREGGGYFTVNFTLELVGPYRAFKLLLNKLPQANLIIRVSQFKVLDYGPGNPAYDWRVSIQFQTYFAS